MVALALLLLASFVFGQVPLLILILFGKGLEAIGALNKVTGEEEDKRYWNSFTYIVQIGGMITTAILMFCYDIGDVQKPIIGFAKGIGYSAIYLSPLIVLFAIFWIKEVLEDRKRRKE